IHPAVALRAVEEDEQVIPLATRARRDRASPEAVALIAEVGADPGRATGARRPFWIEAARARAVALAVLTAPACALVRAVVVGILPARHVAADAVGPRLLEARLARA